MGRRGKVVLRRIEDRRRRGICFRKRLAGMGKKAEELAVLCDAQVGFVVLSRSDGRVHHFAAPATMENIMQRYENSVAAHKGVSGRGILEKSKSMAFHVPKETTDKGSNSGDMRSTDESDISKLNIDQLSQMERVLEEALRWTRARKGKAAIVERSFMEMASGQAKEQVGGAQQSCEEVDLVVRLSLSIGGGGDGDGAAEHRHRTQIDLNVP